MPEIYSKLDAELKLAISLDENERANALDLNVGFDNINMEWELIVRYIGDIDELAPKYGFSYVSLSDGFCIVRIEEKYIEALSKENEIIFINKPNSLFTEIYDREPYYLSCMKTGSGGDAGSGVLCAIIDSGADIYNENFIRDGRTIIECYWDQDMPGNPPKGFYDGSIIYRDDIQAALDGRIELGGFRDLSGHGTRVASIISQAVPAAGYVIVKLENDKTGITKTTSLMKAVEFCLRYSIEKNKPMAINISYGNNYGDHNSNSLIENYIDKIADLSRLSIIIGTGNDGNTGRHKEIMLSNAAYNAEIFLQENVSALNLQIWKSYADEVDIYLYTPSGTSIGPINQPGNIYRGRLGDNEISAVYNPPTPINPATEIFISAASVEGTLTAGIWRVELVPRRIIDGRVNMWLPVAAGTTADVYFTNATPYTTLTIPSTARRAVSVGAYNSYNRSYAGFSGRGYLPDGLVKPDICAPGVDIYIDKLYERVSGTSFAAPFVTAAAVSLMEWGDGVILGLFAQKKAYILAKMYNFLLKNNEI